MAMEPNTSSSAAAQTSPSAVLEHGEPSVRDRSLQSPAFSPAPSPGLLPAPSPSLLPASGSGSEPSLYPQITPSPAIAAGHGSPSGDAHTTSSQSLLSSIPTDGPEATAPTPLPSLLEGQGEQGESSSTAPSVLLPECPSLDLFVFPGESGVWSSDEMPSFFSSSSAGVLVPESSDNLVGFMQPFPDPQLEALPQSLHIHAPAVEESPVDAPLPPIEEDKEEDIDVSAFLVSDLEDRLHNASGMAGPEMAGTGSDGGASASWMAPPGSTSNNWPPMLAPGAASTCTMVSSSSSSSGSHSVSLSMCVAGSMGGTMKPPSAALPLVPPSSQGAGASSSNFNGFPQPSSSSELAPFVPNLHGPLLPVKQEVMEYVDAAAHRHPPDFISLDDNDEDEDGYNVFGSWSSSSSPASFAPGNWIGNSSGSHSFAPGSSGGPSFALGSWGGGSSSSSPSFAGSMPCFDGSTSIDNYGSSSMPMLSLGGKMSYIPGLPPLPKAHGFNKKSSARVIFTHAEMAIIAKENKLHEILRTDPKRVKRMLYNRAYSATAQVRRVMHTKNLERMLVTLGERRKALYAELQSLEEGSAELIAQKMEMQMTIGALERQTMLKDARRRQEEQLKCISTNDTLSTAEYSRPPNPMTLSQLDFALVAVTEGLKAEIENLKHQNPN